MHVCVVGEEDGDASVAVAHLRWYHCKITSLYGSHTLHYSPMAVCEFCRSLLGPALFIPILGSCHLCSYPSQLSLLSAEVQGFFIPLAKTLLQSCSIPLTPSWSSLCTSLFLVPALPWQPLGSACAIFTLTIAIAPPEPNPNPIPNLRSGPGRRNGETLGGDECIQSANEPWWLPLIYRCGL